MSELSEFLREDAPILDVRSPVEYAKGHVPGARNLPLFGDRERAEIGILYKQRGRSEALKRGLEIVGPKMRPLLEGAEEIAPEGEVRLYCARGGMRSEAVEWLLALGGFRVARLEGGYKAFRRWVLASFEVPRRLLVLGGLTGCGKTELLQQLQAQGQAILDLEALANHRGSAFGGLGQGEQPVHQQFENAVAWALAALPSEAVVWVEDECQAIGRCFVPKPFFAQMRAAPVLAVSVPKEARIQRLIRDYAHLPPSALLDAVDRIVKRLGGADARSAAEAIERGDWSEAAGLILRYYDKSYQHGLSRRGDAVFPVELQSPSPAEQAQELVEHAQKLGWLDEPLRDQRSPSQDPTFAK